MNPTAPTAEPQSFPGLLELMPPAARSQRLEALTGLLVEELTLQGSASLGSVLGAVAGSQRMAVSQLKRALSYALAHGRILLDGEDQLSIPKGIEA